MAFILRNYVLLAIAMAVRPSLAVSPDWLQSHGRPLAFFSLAAILLVAVLLIFVDPAALPAQCRRHIQRQKSILFLIAAGGVIASFMTLLEYEQFRFRFNFEVALQVACFVTWLASLAQIGIGLVRSVLQIVVL